MPKKNSTQRCNPSAFMVPLLTISSKIAGVYWHLTSWIDRRQNSNGLLGLAFFQKTLEYAYLITICRAIGTHGLSLNAVDPHRDGNNPLRTTACYLLCIACGGHISRFATFVRRYVCLVRSWHIQRSSWCPVSRVRHTAREKYISSKQRNY